MPKLFNLCQTIVLSLVVTTAVFADEGLKLPPAEKSDEAGYDISAVPFVMSLEDWGWTVALAGVAKGVVQSQASVFAGGAFSENGTYMGYAGLFNFMAPGWDQVMFDLTLMETDFNESRFFLSDNGHAGSNQSTIDDSIRSPAHDKHYQFFMRYTLPVGDGRDGALPAQIKQNFGYNVGREWNPLTSGINTFELQPYFRSRTMDRYPNFEADKSAGIRMTLEYDNRNSKVRPTRGSNTALKVTYDPGSSSRPDWATMELHFSKFFSLGSSDLLDERVIALNGWLADTLTWNSTTDINGSQVYRRPPSYAGVSLGGFDRLRGYSGGRFHGRSAILYSAEYRMVPHWQPLDALPVIGPLYNIPWWQWTLFADVGRVADNFDLGELHSSMKYSLGGGIRFMVEGITVRLEMVNSPEDTFMRVFINQPF